MTERTKRKQIREELEEVRSLSDDGRLHPEHVVAWARQYDESALHDEFEWDDTSAAEKYRVDQARQIIRVVVTREPSVSNKPIRAYVSQATDRIDGGGYRPTKEALVSSRQELVDEALNTITAIENRYTHLPELRTLFATIGVEVARFRVAMHDKRDVG